MLFLISVVTLTNCDLLDDNRSTDYNLLPVEGKYLFKITEEYEHLNQESNPEIFLTLTTEKIYGCCNYGISTDCEITNKKVEIDILGIIMPDICLTALGPAGQIIRLPLSNKIYSLKLSGENFVDYYSVNITDSSISISEDSTNHTKPIISHFWRYPPNSFVYLFGSTFSDSSLARDFLDTLMQIVDIDEFEFPEYGEIPYPRISQGHYWDMPARYFYYNSEDDFEMIESILRNFKENYIKDKEGISIILQNWRGKAFRSWLL